MKKIIHTSGIDNAANILDQRFVDEIRQRSLPVYEYDSWATVERAPIDGWTDLYQEMGKNWEALYRNDDYIAMVRLQSSGNIWVKVGANSVETAKQFFDRIRKVAPASETVDGSITLKFWTNGQRGPQSITRRIDAPKWSEIEYNYSASTRNKVNRLVDGFKPAHGGQLILWHGDPGTGKTYALRSIVREWSKWCSAEYVVDPEAFFGSAPSYMMQVLLDSTSQYAYLDDDEEVVEQQKWRLLIFEDTGELLSRDAGIRSGQGLSRLLNTVDGLIGQGLRVLILITTNEELGSLHAAVSRPGRTAVKAHFNNLDAAEAVQWAQRQGVGLSVERSYSLAELYAMSEGFTESQHEDHRAVGFAPLTAARA